MNFKCDLCEKTFKLICTLKMHVTRMHTHMIIKQVQLWKSVQRARCINCTLPFSEENMKKHMENIHICNFCDSVSKTEIEKKIHMRDKHDKATSSTSPKTKKRKDCDQCSLKAASQQVVTAGDFHGSQVMPGDPCQVAAGPRPGGQKVVAGNQAVAGPGPGQQSRSW